MVTEIDLNSERKYWQQLNGKRMVDESQCLFEIAPPLLPFSENFIIQATSRLLLHTFEWVKSSNNAFKLLE